MKRRRLRLRSLLANPQVPSLGFNGRDSFFGKHTRFAVIGVFVRSAVETVHSLRLYTEICTLPLVAYGRVVEDLVVGSLHSVVGVRTVKLLTIAVIRLRIALSAVAYARVRTVCVLLTPLSRIWCRLGRIWCRLVVVATVANA